MEPVRPLFSSYMTHAHAIVTLMLRLLNTRLGLPPGKLESMHRLRGLAGDQVRLIHSPQQPADDRTLSNGEHTDFGSVTILFNRIGGLQVRLPPGLKPNPPVNGDTNGSVLGKVRLNQDGLPVTKAEEEEWAYVHPLPNHAIVNLGDAMAKFSAGILRSNIHRVMSPPGGQADITRYSLVYFSRPEDDVLLKPLRDDSEMVARVLKETGRDNVAEEEFTSKEWVHRMALGRRGVGKWLYSNSNMVSTKGH
jgi:isopenicillin N synthase-like dioxygenase